MSAYIVDRDTIQYLVQSGLEAAFQHHQGHKMRWYHEGESHWLDDRNASDVGQMLWDENIAPWRIGTVTLGMRAYLVRPTRAAMSTSTRTPR